ncbi:MAG: ribonuclease Z [Chitinophagaceae bacterium]|nr:MAG: ribonuclease Z [Chitinophagaceae bacterium]
MLTLTILGNNSAMPTLERHPTSQVLSNGKTDFLIDCGEGTQTQLLRYQQKINRISHIFISHLHGDHYLGLAGLLNSMALMNRTHDLYLYAVPELFPIIDMQLNVTGGILPYQLPCVPLVKEGDLCKIDDIEVSCFKTNHRITCYGFVFKEIKNPRKINPEAVGTYQIPFSFYEALQKGADYLLPDGTYLPNSDLTEPHKNIHSYAFAADTLYDESMISFIKNVDCLYHESTYLNDKLDLATERYHSTAKQAATLALKAEVGQLIIGHFSSRYKSLEPFLEEAISVFPNTHLALEGSTFKII